MRNLNEVRLSIFESLGAHKLSFGPISTRVLLRTGVNLMEIRSDQDSDPECVRKAIDALADMGYELKGGMS